MPTNGGVLARKWEFRGFICGIRQDGSVANSGTPIELFPEYKRTGTFGDPFRLDGVRLAEVSALACLFEETLLVRICEFDEGKTDLEMVLDSGEFRLSTDDKEAYEVLFDYVDNNDFW
jgi:hypothetical protein